MVRNILNEELGGHSISYNPAIIAIKEAHMIFCNINNESEGSSQTANISKKRATRISDYFCKSGKPTLSGEVLPTVKPVLNKPLISVSY